MRAVLVFVGMSMVATSMVVADPASKPAADPTPKPLTALDQKAGQLLDKLASDASSRQATFDELVKLAPDAIEGISAYLKREHKSTLAERRKILDGIKASVPDKSGKFSQPQRMKDNEQQADEAFDWMARLGDMDLSRLPTKTRSDKPTTPASDENLPQALGETLADDAAIRALALSKQIAGAQPIFDAAFADATMIYRDECGRYLRKMEPLSIPSLTREAMGRNYDRSRYATYQLERLDRQEPLHALSAAQDNEALTVAILDVFRTTKHREAVHAVWTKVDNDAPRVREAARAAWMGYITGDPPPPAPKRKLQLPGGKLTKKPKPLWLTYRELADNELRKAANELLKEDYPLEDPSTDDIERRDRSVKVDLEQLTKRLFDYFDEQRRGKEQAEWVKAKAKADAGDLAGATQMLDSQLALNADRKDTAEMAKIYFAWARQLEAKQQWLEASAAYSKAQGLDPKGAQANEALAGHHYALGKSLEAQGKDGGPDYRRAIALKPDYAPAKKAAAEAENPSAGRPKWMLYGAIVAGVVAIALFAAAMMRRRGVV